MIITKYRLMRIERKEYLDRLVGRMWNGSIKVVTGVRRCGKSYLIFNLFRDYLARSGVDDRHVIVVELDRLENESLREKHFTAKWILSVRRGQGSIMCSLLLRCPRRRSRNRNSVR